MRRLLVSSLVLATASCLLACSSDPGGSGGGGGTGSSGTGGAMCPAPITSGTKIAHVIVIVQENHTFDNHFGSYCTAPAGSNPSCNEGPACCEAAPAKDPSGAAPMVLDDASVGAYDPKHTQACELAEMNGGKMDRYVTGADGCSDPRNFAVAGDAVKIYHDYAAQYAMADRNFQPLVGQSSSNDMYLAVAKYVFTDNAEKPDSLGAQCDLAPGTKTYEGQTVFDVIGAAGKTFRVYAEGYDRMKGLAPDACPGALKECTAHLPAYPCLYQPSDIPFLYYSQFNHDDKLMHDYAELAKDVTAGTLANVSFVKFLGYNTEHPGYATKLTAGPAMVDALVKQVQASCYADDTLVLIAWDEGGGYYDHLTPPADSTADMKPYGTRVPLLAIGRFAKKNYVSHVVMEHSSIVKFLELNFTGKTGQLGARDAVVNNIGSLLDPKETGISIPDN
ncbi:MAG: alkaline phosphatase family protein [Byssovorax sp.]